MDEYRCWLLQEENSWDLLSNKALRYTAHSRRPGVSGKIFESTYKFGPALKIDPLKEIVITRVSKVQPYIKQAAILSAISQKPPLKTGGF